MRARTVWVAFVLSAVVAGCAMPLVPGGEWTERGTVVFRAEAWSLVAKADDPLSVLEAKHAAATMAKAALLEKVVGAQVSGRVGVDGLMFQEQEAVVEVEGTLSRARVEFVEPVPDAEPGLITAVAELELSRRQLRRLCRYAD